MKSLIIVATLLILTFAGDKSKAPQLVNADQVVLDIHNTVNFRGTVNGSSVNKAIVDLHELLTKRGNKNYPIYIVLDSPGGSISDGLAFIAFAENYANIKTIGLDAASMASAIMMHLPGERLATSTSVLMFHRARISGLGGQIEDGEAESRLNMIKKMVRHMEQKSADRIGITLSEYKNKVLNEWWVFGQDNKKQNVVDRIVNIKCTSRLIKKRENAYMQSMFGSSSAEYSGCPLLRTPVK